MMGMATRRDAALAIASAGLRIASGGVVAPCRLACLP